MSMISERVDVVVLGGGGGGSNAAFLLARRRRVVLADPQGNLGGSCLAEGCVPSKAVREASLVRARAGKYAFFGLRGDAPGVDWRGVLAHKDRVQQTRYLQNGEELDRSGVTFHAGQGRVVGERAIEIDAADGTHRYEFGDLIIATGSRPRRLKVPGAELAITSHELFRPSADLAFPKQLIVVGGGYIGVEVASMLNNFGARITVLEYTDQLLPGFDPELAQALHSSLGRRVRVEVGAEVTAIDRAGGSLRVSYRQGGAERSVEGDAVLMATGRDSVVPEGIEALGLGARAPLAVDTRLRTANPRVYAPGDVNGRSMPLHSAVRQSLVAAHNILAGGQPVARMDFESVPFTVFTEPELAHVGLTESQARERYGSVEVARYGYSGDARAIMLDETEGFIKLVFDTQSGRLIGAQVAGLDAAQTIAPLTLAVSQGLGAESLTTAVFPHPMLSEGINKAARHFQP